MSISPSINTMISSCKSVVKPANHFENFVIGRQIGSGSFSVVKLATHIRSNQTVAFKILKIDDLEMTTERIWREIDNLQQCTSHPHILHIYDVKHGSPMHKDLTIITEYVHGGNLYKLIHEQKLRRLPLNKARYLFQQIVSGLDYMHHHHIAHRDLTLDNILIDENQTFIKIADLGFSRRVPDKGGGKMSTACGSPNYSAPELLCGTPYDGLAVDIWSLGVVLYIMLSGFMPFNEDKQKDLFQKIRAGIYYIPKTIGRDAKKLISTMLTVDATTRITISGVRKSTFYRKRLPKCLEHSPEAISTNLQCIDPVVMDKLLERYGESDIPQANDASSENDELFNNIPVTRDIIERVLSNIDCPNNQSYSDITQDVRLAYNLMLHKKVDTAYCKLLRKRLRRTFCSQFVILCVLCVFFFDCKILPSQLIILFSRFLATNSLIT